MQRFPGFQDLSQTREQYLFFNRRGSSGYVHTKTIVNANDSKRIFLSPSTQRRSSFAKRFQIYPLWSAFSNLCVYGQCFHRLRVDGRPERIKKFVFTIVCVYNRLRVDRASISPFNLIEHFPNY